MKTIPRYWAFAPTQEGILVWRSSPESEAAARDAAWQAANRISQFEQGNRQNEPGKYPYGVTLREKLLGEIHDTRGQLQGFVTRNQVGAEVLNVKNVMFLDWDTPVPRTRSLWEHIRQHQSFQNYCRVLGLVFQGKIFRIFKELFQDWRNDPWPKHEENWGDHPPKNWEQDYTWVAVPELAAFMPAVTQWPDWGVRVYKTFAGYRGLVTHVTFDPTAETTLNLMRQFRCVAP